MKKFKILNLYAGIGGNRKLWDETLKQKFGNNYQITAIEYDENIAAVYRDYFPNDIVIVTDAHQHLLDHFKEFDFIWSSPPCQSHSAMARVNHKRYNLIQYPDMKLYQEIIFLDSFFKGKWIIENVNPYYKPLLEYQKVGRHLIWSNFNIPNYKKDNVKNFIDADYKTLQKWLGIKMDKKIYLGKNHDYCQVLRNCIHPDLGLLILNKALNIITEETIPQGKLF